MLWQASYCRHRSGVRGRRRSSTATARVYLCAAFGRDGEARLITAMLHHVLDIGLRLRQRHLEVAVLCLHALALFQSVLAPTVNHLHTVPHRFKCMHHTRSSEQPIRACACRYISAPNETPIPLWMATREREGASHLHLFSDKSNELLITHSAAAHCRNRASVLEDGLLSCLGSSYTNTRIPDRAGKICARENAHPCIGPSKSKGQSPACFKVSLGFLIARSMQHPHSCLRCARTCTHTLAHAHTLICNVQFSYIHLASSYGSTKTLHARLHLALHVHPLVAEKLFDL